MDKIDEIKEKLKELKTLDSKYEIFGASHHKYAFNEPMTLDQLDEFETKYQVKLPTDYKRFLNKIGNGGAGPYYGIHPLSRNLGKFNPENKFENLKLAFPHYRKWNWSKKILDRFEKLKGDEDEEIAEFFDTIFWQQYGKEELTSGSLYISEYGCALRYLLIVTGADIGKIWFDQRADHDGINPVVDNNGKKLDFYSWYLEWLDKSINEIKKQGS